MKPKNSNFRKGILFPGMTAMLIIVILIFSCKKSSVDPTVKNDMSEAARAMDGKMFSGTITTQGDEEGIVLNYNNDNKIICIENIKGTEPIHIADIRSAEIITSDYGVILKDVNNNKVFILTTNDPKSAERAERVKSIFSGNFEAKEIFGVIIINTERA